MNWNSQNSGTAMPGDQGWATSKSAAHSDRRTSFGKTLLESLALLESGESNARGGDHCPCSTLAGHLPLNLHLVPLMAASLPWCLSAPSSAHQGNLPVQDSTLSRTVSNG